MKAPDAKHVGTHSQLDLSASNDLMRGGLKHPNTNN
jgi:hypothetical protein